MTNKNYDVKFSPIDKKNIWHPEIETSRFWRFFPGAMRRRWWLFRPFDLVARNLPVFFKRKGVLVVRMDGIGDMTLFRQSLEHYEEAFGVSKQDITILGCKSWATIAKQIFEGYQIITINEHAFAKKILYRFFVSVKVRLLGVAVAVCDSYFRRALMADSLVWVSGAPKMVVSYPYISETTRSEFKYYLSQAHLIINTGDYPTHEIVRHARFVSALLGRDIMPEFPKINWVANTPTIFRKLENYVILVPGSNEFGRRWPLEGYKTLAEKFAGVGFNVLIVGHVFDNFTWPVFSQTEDGAQITNLTGKTSLPDLLYLLKNAALVVSNDTGTAHLAIGLGAPTVVLVGGGHFSSFFPYPPNLTPSTTRFISYKMPCYHCFWRCTKRDSKRSPFPCIESIGVEQVWSESKKILSADSA